MVAGGPAEAVSLPLAFSGAVTTATVTPADAAQGVAVSVQVEVEATAPLDPSPTNLSRAKLFKGTEPVEVKLLLSGSGKRLAVVPVKPLAVSTVYTFTVAGLKDAANEDVVVASPVSFTTKDFVAPVVNTNAIVFSYPENGMTKVTAPPGSLPPFSEVLILNATNGAALWLQVDGEGCIGCLGGSNELPATINDRLMVTITDPQGNVTTFERSKFVKADGTVAIGPGGGTVEGAGGVELRIPSGALENGAELKVEGLSAETLLQQFPGQVPDLGRRTTRTSRSRTWRAGSGSRRKTSRASRSRSTWRSRCRTSRRCRRPSGRLPGSPRTPTTTWCGGWKARARTAATRARRPSARCSSRRSTTRLRSARRGRPPARRARRRW